MRALVIGSTLAAVALAAAGCAGGGTGGGGLGSAAALHRVKKQNMGAGDFRTVDLATLAAEGKTMRNAPVRVRSLLLATSDARATLRDPAGQGAASVPVDLSPLEPNEKELIAARCTAAPCEAEILGIVQAPLVGDSFYIVAYQLRGVAGEQPG